MLLTKFGRSQIKHVGKEADCEKKERRRKEKQQERNKLRRKA